MDGNADVILKETRQGKTRHGGRARRLLSRREGFRPQGPLRRQPRRSAGQNLTGTTQSLGDKLPVTVKLLRKPTGDTFEFRGQIAIGQAVTEVTSTDNSDLSEKEFQDNQTTDDGITPQPKDFTEVSPEAIAVQGQARCRDSIS